MAFIIDFKILRHSIVNTQESSEVKKDESEPYSFVEFVKNLDTINIDNEFVVDAYNQYLIEWSGIKREDETTFAEQRKAKYVELLKTIQINFVTQDEERILGNIDYNNPLELEVAIPFFVEKIKDTIEYYSKKRRDVKSSKVRWSTKGSSIYLENIISEYIIDNYTKNENTFQKYKQDFQDRDEFQQNFEIEYNGMYDLNYYGQDEVLVDPTTFPKDTSDYDLSAIPLSGFTEYYRDETKIIDELKKDLYAEYVSTDNVYYENGVAYPVKSTTPFYDHANRHSPLISRISDNTNLLTDKEIGYYFTSRYIYSSNYFSPAGVSLKDTSELTELINKPAVYLSEDYLDYNFWNKYDPSKQGLSDKPVTNSRLKRLHGYQSRDTNLGDASGGVERSTDNIQIWDGVVWANEDVFPKFDDIILDDDVKNEFFFHLGDNESVYKFSMDIYGNEYYLIKKTKNTLNTNQNNIYPLRTFVGGDATAEFLMLGQRLTAIDDLKAIDLIDSEIVAGFYIGGSETTNTIETFADFGLDDVEYHTLEIEGFDTIYTDELSSDIEEYKSVYENYYTEGRIVVRDATSSTIDSFDSFAIDSLTDGVIDINITNDIVMIHTVNEIITSKVIYDDGILQFGGFSNITDNYNDLKHKSSLLWNIKSTEVYYADVEISDVNEIIPTIYRLDINSNVSVSMDIIDNVDNNVDHPLDWKTISRPTIIEDNSTIYVSFMLTDTGNNISLGLVKYETVGKNTLSEKYCKVWIPSQLEVREDSTYPLSGVIDDEIGFYDFDTELVYYDTELSAMNSADIPYHNTEEKSFYDNDTGEVETVSHPNLQYSLGELLDTAIPTLSASSDNTILYEFETEVIYSPCEIELDFLNINDFNTLVPATEPIYKIEFTINNKVTTVNILDSDNVGEVYNPNFPLSPINMVPTTARLESGGIGLAIPTPIEIVMYSASGITYSIIIDVLLRNVDIGNRYGKIEMLDTRIITSPNASTGINEKKAIFYLNTRASDSITAISVINI